MPQLKVLLISSLGTSLRRTRYELPETIGPWRRRSQATTRRIGASAALEYLPDETEQVDTLLLTTAATEPQPIDSKYRECDRCERSGRQVVESEFEEAMASHSVSGGASTPTFRHTGLRLEWETTESSVMVDQIVGLPPRIEQHLRQTWSSGFEDYHSVLVDVGAGLRPLAMGLWLTASYLAFARGHAGRLVAFYAEFFQDQSAIWFDESGEPCTHLVRPQGGEGRLFDLTPLFDSVSAIAAVSHLAQGLDFRTALVLVGKLDQSRKQPALSPDVAAFAECAQLGLDIDAAAYAHELTAASKQRSEEPAALVHSLVREITDVATSWTLPALSGGDPVALPRPPKPGKTSKTSKGKWPLDVADLVRHARVVNTYRDHGRLSDALAHAREFCISAIQLRTRLRFPAGRESWLDHGTRVQEGERIFGALCHYGQHGKSLLEARGARAEDLERIADLAKIQELRNAVAHTGRRKQWALEGQHPAEAFEQAWTRLSPPLEDKHPQPLDTWLTTGWPGRLLPLALPTGRPLLAAALPRGRASGALLNALLWAKRKWSDGFDLLLLATDLALQADPMDDLLAYRDRFPQEHWLHRCLEEAGLPQLSAAASRLELNWASAWGAEAAGAGDHPAASRYVLVRMVGGRAPLDQRSVSKLAEELVKVLVTRLLNATVFATSIAGATAYQTLCIQAIATEVAKGGAKIEHWLISREGGTPGPGEDPFDQRGVTLAIDGEGSWDLPSELAEQPARQE